MKSSLILSVILSFGLMAVGHAAAPPYINYQGKLADNTGNPITNASQAVEFRIYDTAAVGTGTLLWSESHTLNVANGIFSVQLGSLNSLTIPANIFAAGITRYLELRVGGQPLSPRQQLVASPYALAVAAGSVGSAEIVDGSIVLADMAPGAVTTSNAANTIVLRDGAGNFSAGSITATNFAGSGTGLTGTAAGLSVNWGNVIGRPTDNSAFTNGSGYFRNVTMRTTSISNGDSVSSSCNAGEVLVGGGCFHNAPRNLRFSYPSSSTTWSCRWTTVDNEAIIAYAICATR